MKATENSQTRATEVLTLDLTIGCGNESVEEESEA